MSKQEELDKVKEKILKDDLPLKEGSTNLVFGKGNPGAKILFIGEAPGEREDALGIPFVGRAGKELDRLLSEIGLKLEDVYIANILKYRPPGNRDPTKFEVEKHTPYLIEQIKIIKPEIIVTLGNFASKFVLASFDSNKMKNVDGITKIHGNVSEIRLDSMKFKVMPLYHPAAVLYRGTLRVELENDFVKLGDFIKGKNLKEFI